MYNYNDNPEDFVKLLAKSLAYELTTTDINFLREFLCVMIDDMALMDEILNTEDEEEQNRIISLAQWNILDVVQNKKVTWSDINKKLDEY